MSVTTTANPVTYSLQTVLADYNLHHTEEEVDTSLNAHPAPAGSNENPSSWPTEHRRVPAYRPINTELDQSERRVYLSGVEQAFVTVMFTGVFLESVRIHRRGCEYIANRSYRLYRNYGGPRWAKYGTWDTKLAGNGEGREYGHVRILVIAERYIIQHTCISHVSLESTFFLGIKIVLQIFTIETMNCAKLRSIECEHTGIAYCGFPSDLKHKRIQ